jgi:hypothetical protein
MDQQSTFLQQGFERVKLDLLDTIGQANLHLKPETITRSLRAKVRAKLKVLETILRRLILVLAMSLKLDPVKPRPSAPAASAQEGVEDVTTSFKRHIKSYRMALMGRPLGPVGIFPETRRTAPKGPVLAAPLLVQAAVLLRIMKHPDAAARRMARLLDRIRKRGEGRPHCAPLAGRHRLTPQLGLIASLLTAHVKTALDTWYDTG